MQISTGKLAVLVVAVALAFGGIGAALGGWSDADVGPPVQLAGDVDARKHDADDELGVEDYLRGLIGGDDDDDGDATDDGVDTANGTLGTSTAANNPPQVATDDGVDTTNGTLGTSTGANNPSQVAVLEGRTAAQWMASARLYKQRWLHMKQANHRHGQQVRNLRASLRQQVAPSPGPRVYRGGGDTSVSGGGDT